MERRYTLFDYARDNQTTTMQEFAFDQNIRRSDENEFLRHADSNEEITGDRRPVSHI